MEAGEYMVLRHPSAPRIVNINTKDVSAGFGRLRKTKRERRRMKTITQHEIQDTRAFFGEEGRRMVLELGGVDGIHALDMLRTLVKPTMDVIESQLMDMIEGQFEAPLRPCDVFDDYLGFGSGRLLVVMFRILKMVNSRMVCDLTNSPQMRPSISSSLKRR